MKKPQKLGGGEISVQPVAQEHGADRMEIKRQAGLNMVRKASLQGVFQGSIHGEA